MAAPEPATVGGASPETLNSPHTPHIPPDPLTGTLPPPAGEPPEPSFGALLSGLWEDLPGLFSDRVHLFALELKRARGALVRMIGLLVLAAILGLTAWVSFWVLVVAAGMRYGVPWDGACLFVLVVNLLAAWFALRRTSRLAGYLALPATMRQLTIKKRQTTQQSVDENAAQQASNAH